jgi:ectoine hydroxylase-related dioxygenase (phytanoyl-CoA dioxygenase family)
MVRPVKWLDDSDFYGDDRERYVDAPALDDAESRHRVLAWPMAPGDAVLFHFRTLHGAAGNEVPARRRAFSARWVGDDVRYVQRPGRTSPPFPGHGMAEGERLREDWFPVLWPRPGQWELENNLSGTQ